MMIQIRKRMTALGERFENSKFQQRIYDWQDAHPVATERIDKALRVTMSVLCHALMLFSVLLTVLLATQIYRHGMGTAEAVFMLAAVFAGWFGVHTLRSL